MSPRLRLGVNIDHVATIRNARGGSHPEPLRAAQAAIAAGADGITAHLREDRRHISDSDIDALSALCSRLGKPLNFEMAVTDEMQAIALRHRPHAACLVPERREERTTEGGLDVARGHAAIGPVVRALRDAGIRVSLFIEANPIQIAVAKAMGAQVVELHTGAYCDAVKAGETDRAVRLLDQLKVGAADAHRRGLEVHAGHGIDFDSVKPVAAVEGVTELNIGHFLIGEAIFIGLDAAIARMRALMDEARAS
jgi:pyridoxine 5-phosphate synthase